ncbi:MAG TPA: 4Fe-4S dicluster domain-containing protein [Syntrophomonadaceae bacterium]|nr:4Fe-4S dicluster domain-containing protein [Syntrophomonadaceae bacterium]HQD91446.1 4Fe-4S dicluster domain-containing protein [Syntrophomonadaceae bacterium]
MTITRRTFLKRAALSGVTAAVMLSGTQEAVAQISPNQQYATIIDLTKCDGCIHQDTPACVLACRSKNRSNFPQPEKPIENYWPQPFHEDWSDKQEVTNRLTPYNWTYVQHLEVEHQGVKATVHVPRRCMHCDNPPCSGLCPFGVNNKTPEGAVVIDTDICFGGAKCRDVCPWKIPQRQAGVGLYKKVAPKFAGGGVMYKCDMCIDLIKQGQEPACVTACPNQAITFGPKEKLRNYARQWVEDNQGYIYGDIENGGTSTFYLSKIPFEAINQAIKEQEADGKPGRPTMEVEANNALDEPENLAKAFVIAPVAGILAAGLSVYKTMQGEEKHENTEA